MVNKMIGRRELEKYWVSRKADGKTLNKNEGEEEVSEVMRLRLDIHLLRIEKTLVPLGNPSNVTEIVVIWQ